jgi:hypothetical protein
VGFSSKKTSASLGIWNTAAPIVPVLTANVDVTNESYQHQPYKHVMTKVMEAMTFVGVVTSVSFFG